MKRAEYATIEAVNWSTLRHMAKSPAHYRYYQQAEVPDTSAMLLGRAVHKAILDPRAFGEDFAIWPGTRRGKDWESFRDGVGIDKDILQREEHNRCLALQAAVRDDPVAADFLRGGESEVCLRWDEPAFKIPCKGLCDRIRTGDHLLVDVKTTRDASPSGFGREVARYNYHCQMAHYAQGYEAQYGHRPRVVLIAVEKDGPMAVACYDLPDDVLNLGRDMVDSLLEAVRDCTASGTWPGYAVGGTLQLQLPKWAMPDTDEPGAEEW